MFFTCEFQTHDLPFVANRPSDLRSKFPIWNSINRCHNPIFSFSPQPLIHHSEHTDDLAPSTVSGWSIDGASSSSRVSTNAYVSAVFSSSFLSFLSFGGVLFCAIVSSHKKGNVPLRPFLLSPLLLFFSSKNKQIAIQQGLFFYNISDRANFYYGLIEWD